jgi:Lrp/AsnC family transcriptional regulator for asnA, asnC and gidA
LFSVDLHGEVPYALAMERDVKVDKIDLKIIEILKKNGRIPNKEIAKILELSEGTIGNRINKLLKNHLIKIVGLTSPAVFPEKQFIYLGIKIDSNKLSIKISQEIEKLPGVKSVAIITGQYDILVELFMEISKLINFLNKELSRVESIVSVESFVVLQSFSKYI